MNLISIRSIWVGIFLFSQAYLVAQSVKPSASEIQLGLKKLNSLGSVLYLAAHPDDENTNMIAYMANEALLNTAYLSITRGDGGQNLIGPEIREMLGVIRTQELLQARRLDGGQQFFTRAVDFGYSKNPEETLQIWDKEKVLADVVWVIRQFRPDVIITRFPTDGRGRHGHHTASAILAEEAFDAAADPKRFPEQLQHVDPWQTRSLMFNTTWWFYGSPENFDSEGMVPVDVGAYNPLLGKSYTEISATSRSMHKSQGFGSTGSRGASMEYLEYVKGERLTEDFFKHPIKKWESIEGGQELQALLKQAYQDFNPEKPDQIVPVLVQAKSKLKDFADPYWRDVKSKQLDQLILDASGLYLEASTREISATPGDSLHIRVEVTNRSSVPVTLTQIELESSKQKIKEQNLSYNQKFEQELDLAIPEDQPYSQPYWLQSPGSLGMFEVSDKEMIGQPENEPAISIPFVLNISGSSITYEVPLIHKSNDPVKGEVRQPLAITPPVSINFYDKVQVFANESPRNIQVKIKSGKANVSGTLSMEVPAGWKIDPEQVNFELIKKGEEQDLSFMIHPPDGSDEGEIWANAIIDGARYNHEQVIISYDHIPNQVLLPEAAAKIVKLDIVAGGYNIGYVMGAGDDIPNSLQQIGYSVDQLDLQQLNKDILSKYHAIVLGIRALNTVEQLKYHMQDLLSYVERGGTLVVQYNTSHRLITEDFAPYPLSLSRDRVSVEDAPVAFVLPDHKVLNEPNKITNADFDGWVQERGLYFPNQWDSQYQAVLSMNDPGESAKTGGLLVAKYGEGHYVYTGLSWFRELPAGVPGAYRLFANILSLGQPQPEN